MKRDRTKKLDGTPRKTTAGVPSKWRPALGEKLVELVRRGNYFTVACAACGISYSSFDKYRAIGRKHLEDGIESDLAAFADALTRAEAEAEVAAIKVLEDAAQGLSSKRVRKHTKNILDKDGVPLLHYDANGDPLLDAQGRVQYVQVEDTATEVTVTQDWRAAAMFLQSRHPERYHHRVAMSGNMKHAHDHSHKVTGEDKAIMERVLNNRMGLTSTN